MPRRSRPGGLSGWARRRRTGPVLSGDVRDQACEVRLPCLSNGGPHRLGSWTCATVALRGGQHLGCSGVGCCERSGGRRLGTQSREVG